MYAKRWWCRFVLGCSPALSNYLFDRFEAARPRANAQGFQESDVGLGVNPAVKVSAGWRDAAFPLKRSEVLRGARKLAGGLAYVECNAVHRRTA
jgi:hypothetical protein